MWGWIVALLLYTLGMGLFHIFGGLRAAGEAIENWGRSHAAGREEQLSASRS